jgi:hypothetical protein
MLSKSERQIQQFSFLSFRVRRCRCLVQGFLATDWCETSYQHDSCMNDSPSTWSIPNAELFRQCNESFVHNMMWNATR